MTVDPTDPTDPTEAALAPTARRPPRHLADLDATEATEAVGVVGHQPFRARQIATHYFTHLTRDPAEMSDLPASGRADLVGLLLPDLLTPVQTQRADGGATVKTLWRCHDGTAIESVLMGYPDRATVCLSCQAGCGMACPFCATGTMGLVRNLSSGEMVEQVRLAARAVREGDLPGGPDRLSNVVFMGMGEPLGNYAAVMRAIRRIVGPPGQGLGISARSVTVSTCGLVPGMERLAAEGLPLRLAVSLHAPDDALRDELVPVNRRWPVHAVLKSAYGYYRATGRRVSIEYALIRDINDSAWRADLLAKRLAAYGTEWIHVNPIPLNPTPGSKWTASDPGVQETFVSRLRDRGIPCTVRDTRGRQIDGACGQLAVRGGQ